MTPAQLRRLCLSFNAAVEDFPFNPETSVFKVGGKLFALSTLDRRPLTVNLKCDPEDAVRLRAEHPGLITPGYHMLCSLGNPPDPRAALEHRHGGRLPPRPPGQGTGGGLLRPGRRRPPPRRTPPPRPPLRSRAGPCCARLMLGS